jgi:hypothetical protein
LSNVASVTHAEEFDVPASAVWQLLLDWAAIVDWMPGGVIASLRMEGQGIGAIRHLVTGKGVALSERLDSADEKAGILELSLVGQLPWGLLSYRARAQVLGISPESCQLTWRGTFETPESGEQADRVAHLLAKSYANMFLGVRRETARRHRHPR